MAYIKAQYSVTRTIYVEVDDEMVKAAKASDDLDDIVNEVYNAMPIEDDTDVEVFFLEDVTNHDVLMEM